MNFLKKVNLNKNIEASDQFCKFDFDPVPEIIEEHLKLSGWVIGIESPVVGVELIQDGQLVGEAPLTINRPHADQIHANLPGAERSGFYIDLLLENINIESGQILIQAVFEDFKRIPLADLNLSKAEESDQDLAQAKAELHNTREELERLQSQFDEVLAELEQTHWQLHQIQTKQSDSDVIVDSCQQVIEVNPEDIQSYYRFLEVQPENSDIWLQLANILVEQNRLEDAISAYRRLVELSPCEEYYQQLGELLVKQEKWDDAIIAYRGAIEFNPEAYQYHYQLGEAIYHRVMENPETFFSEYNLAEVDPKEYQIFSPELPELCFLNDEKFTQATSHLDDETYVIELYRVYLRREPSNFEKENGINWLRADHTDRLLGLIASRQELPELQSLLHHSLLSVCLQESINAYRKATELNYNHYRSHYRIIEILTKQGKSNEAVNLCYDLSLHLAKQGSLNEAVECFSLLPEINQLNVGLVCEYLWNTLNNNMNYFNENSFYSTVTIKLNDALDYFRKKSNYKKIKIYDLNEKDKVFLEQLGLSLSYLEIMSKDNLLLEEIYINNFSVSPTNLTSKKTRNPQYGPDFWHTGQYLSQSLIETGYVYSVCPISGQVIRSNQSFFVFPSFFYRFVGQEIFYLLISDWYHGRTCIYLPKWDLIIEIYPSQIHHEDTINTFKAYSVINWSSFKSYISSPDKKVVALIGDLMNNLTHYMWEIAGFQYLDENSLLDEIDKVLVGPYDFFNVGDLFPEITKDKIEVFDSSIALYQSIIENNYCAVRLVECFIQEKLAERIYQASLKKCSKLFLEEVEKSSQNFPVLWIPIRSHRVWTSQVQGIANIINNLYVDFPNLSIIFDGWSRTEKHSEDDESRIAIEIPIMEKIIAMIPPEINTYNAIGRMTYEKAVWVHAIDLYISPIGAGLCFTVWVVNKPGVAHGHTMFTASETQESSYYNCRENATERPVLLPLDKITDEDSSFWFTRNYDCDWNTIYHEVVKIINGLSKKDKRSGINGEQT
ncbi:tetratricopeptide repeat protein [Planktothrix agardhii]|jgi:tetratricopeptide (TPR) repeat protein|uniref:tetratricopeptide repeat protein n=1 Tax=Planktothrix agardhii TaxID=1160 RepID=UPI001D0BA9B6|nr:tetratricopeptide repeat protein [Planktothrix agardhii]MCB8786461.1 tetratricopeptide repeat protein [Planktothrix agardhii 1025]MCF3578700.1 tetratricopeptide repeat protein [Planktothrix agardhii 1812]MCF3611896.1 tetratricopeptide repeat protein [Planktothrix agardhii 1027]MCF3645671.1 tetratricopeptide repeat protein [Planktothrix agardhii 1026]